MEIISMLLVAKRVKKVLALAFASVLHNITYMFLQTHNNYMNLKGRV